MKVYLVFLFLALLIGCERTPDSLDPWRKAEGGIEKIAGFAKSADESMAVRERAIQILVEDEQLSALTPIFKDLSKDVQEKLVSAAIPAIDAKWAKKDWPKIKKGVETETGRMKVKPSESASAKDMAYYLYPFAGATDKKKIEAILAEWTSADQDIRTQIGKTTLGQAASRAGQEGIDNMLKWIASTKKVATVARKIRKDASKELREQLDEGIRKRAEAAHPNLKENEVEVAVLETETAAIVPYLNRAIRDEKSPASLVDATMDILVKIQGPKSTALFSEMVSKRRGLIRWVSTTRLIEIRGKSGILLAAKALPLEANRYDLSKDDALKKESEIFCNFVDTEMKKQKVADISDILKRGLASNRWPVKMLALRCTEISKQSKLKGDVEALISDKTALNGFKDMASLGDLAKDVASKL